MPEAKISLTTEAKNEGLEKLNKALAEGQQSVASMTRELNDLRKATKDGTQATKEQTEAMINLRQSINAQKAANSAYSKEIGRTTAEIKNSVKAMADGDKGARGLASAFKLTEGFTTAFSVALGNLASTILTGAVSAMGALAGQVISLGAQMQQSVAHMAAMTGATGDATEAYRALNDVYRNTNFNEEAVMSMGTQLMRMGYSAQNSAALIQLCADAAAGLGTGQQGAQQLVDAISRMQAVGELTSKQMTQLKMSGVDLDKAFASLGLNGEQAMKAVEAGTLDTQKAIGALTDYLHQYDGKMAESKDNTIDAWSDVTGNLQTMCAEIGAGIFDAFNKSGIVQELIGFTQALVDMVRGEGCGAFSDLKAVAGEVLDFIGGLLGFVLNSVKLIILILDDAYTAFKNFGAEVVEAIRPAVDMVLMLYDAVKSVLSSVGKNFGTEVQKSWSSTFGSNLEPEERAERLRDSKANNFKQTSRAGGGTVRSGGGGGGGSAKAQLSEEEKAIEAVIKKYADAEKQKWNLAKATQELAKVNMGMLVGENKAEEEKRIKLQALADAHDQLIEGYNNELKLAQQIKDADVRNDTIARIKDQITAENTLYEAQKKAVLFQDNMTDLQAQSKSILEAAFGDPEDIRPKIDAIKENLISAMRDVDAAMANPDPEAQLNGLAKILQTTPELLAEDLATKGQSLAEFAKQYKTALANTAAAEAQSITASQQWHDRLKNYAIDVGRNMGNALTDWITGAKSASEAMKGFVKDLIKNAIQLMAQWTGIYLTFLAFGLGDPHMAAQAATKAVFGVSAGGKSTVGKTIGFSADKGYYEYATGGYITGPGTGTSDSIPAMLSNGEYVIRSEAVDRIGVGTLNAINAGQIPRFADGGSVGDTTESGAGGGVINLHVSALDAASFDDFLQREGLDRLKQAFFEDNRRFASGAGVW